MQIYTHTLPGGAQLIGYLRDRTVEMPAFNTRPAILILPGGGYAEKVAVPGSMLTPDLGAGTSPPRTASGSNDPEVWDSIHW